ncbi:glycoside hydrolase family 5 protein [Agaribacterium sp. ZY112]|uniref:glycoside hydrolase family 5 protein n=1 Tax=Agaribacterium sp. ZY112 TaxID=3233574 RepID=UPI003523178E
MSSRVAPAFLFLCVCFFTSNVLAESSSHPGDGEWWFTPYPEQFDTKLLKNDMPYISVKGNQFVDEDGKPIIFRGLNFSDPDKLKKNRKWDKKHFKVASEWGTNLIRLPIHPIAWESRGEEAYIALLDEAVIWANELNIYLVFDWHSMGNIFEGLYQHRMYRTNMDQTKQFWQTIAHRYKDVPTVAFYELFNEPTDGDGRFGELTWPEWKRFNTSLIDLIAAYDPTVVSLVAGFDWAYDLSEARGDLIDRPNVAYVSHPYPQKAEGPTQAKQWDEKFGFVTEHAPLMATEIGWMRTGERGGHYPVINDDMSYGPAIMDYLDAKGASWVAWVFDPDWTPNMYEGWSYKPTQQGEYFRKVMLEKK